MKKLTYILLLVTTLVLSACSSSPKIPNVDVPSHRKPSSSASVLELKNNTEIKKESDLKELVSKLKNSTYKYDTKSKVYTWDLKGGILDGKKQKGDGSQSENQEPLFRAKISLIIKNGFIRNNKDAATFYEKNSGIEKVTWLNVGEDAVTAQDGAENFFVKNCEFLNDSDGDKSIQLNEAKNAKIENNLIYKGITGVRVFKTSYSSSSDKAYAKKNKFVACDTAWNVAKGTLIIEEKNKYDHVRLPFKVTNGGKIKDADGKVEND